MVIFQYQITGNTEEELKILPEFNSWLCDLLYSKINTHINRKKISVRLNTISSARWIIWQKNAVISTEDIMKAIHDSLTYKIYRKNVVKLQIDNNKLIPYSYTSIDKLIRFLEYGDLHTRATSMFARVTQEWTSSKLQTYWTMFINSRITSCITNIKFIV